MATDEASAPDTEAEALVSIADYVGAADTEAILAELRASGVAASASALASSAPGGEYRILVPESRAAESYDQIFGDDGQEPPGENWFEDQAIWLRALLLVVGVLISVVVIFFLMRLAIG